MAKFDAKSFNEKAFGKYMSAIPNVKLNKLRESRAIVGDARLRDTFVNNSQTGTVYAVLPFFGLLSGTPQNYDGVDNVTPGKTDTFEQGVFTVEAVAEDTGKGIKAQDAYTEYTTYILGEGAIGFEDVGAKVPYEMVRDAKTRGGEDTLISRKRHAVSVSGVSYLKADQKTNSPTNTELGNGKNWSLVASDTKTIEHKAVPIARIISRG